MSNGAPLFETASSSLAKHDLMTYSVAYRLNVSASIGLGHLIRLQALSKTVGEGVFVVPSEGHQILLNQGIDESKIAIAVDTSADWLNAYPNVTHVVADLQHHGNREAAQVEIEAMCRSGRHVTVIDSMPPDNFELGSSSTLPDLVVRPYYTPKTTSLPGKTWLAGARYAILGTSIAEARKVLVMGQELEPHILLTCGGRDPHNLSADILQCLVKTSVPVTVIVGPLFETGLRVRLYDIAKACPHIALLESQKDLARHYLKASLVIGQPGLIRYEAAALGRHGLYYWSTPEYQSYFEDLNESGLGRFFHCSTPGAWHAFLAEVEALGHGVSVPTELNKAALDLVDGKGGERIAAMIASDEKQYTE